MGGGKGSHAGGPRAGLRDPSRLDVRGRVPERAPGLDPLPIDSGRPDRVRDRMPLMAAPFGRIPARRWPPVITASVLVSLTLFHLVAFGSASRRYQMALANARSVGLALGPAASRVL